MYVSAGIIEHRTLEHYCFFNTNPHVNVTVRLLQIPAPGSSVCRQSTKLTRDSGGGGCMGPGMVRTNP